MLPYKAGTKINYKEIIKMVVNNERTVKQFLPTFCKSFKKERLMKKVKECNPFSDTLLPWCNSVLMGVLLTLPPEIMEQLSVARFKSKRC
jgi:hypothetical protein